MRIAMIGAGNVGGTLGRRFAELGHDVTFGLREGSDVKGGTPPRARTATVADAVKGAEVVVLATPWGAVADAIDEMGPLGGKVLIDATNPLTAGLTLDVGPRGESGAERVAALAAGARVVKAFNTTGFNNMADPVYDGAPTLMLVAGDDRAAKDAALRLARELGFDAVDAGPLTRARELEHLAMLWISLAYGGLGRDIAFRLVRR